MHWVLRVVGGLRASPRSRQAQQAQHPVQGQQLAIGRDQGLGGLASGDVGALHDGVRQAVGATWNLTVGDGGKEMQGCRSGVRPWAFFMPCGSTGHLDVLPSLATSPFTPYKGAKPHLGPLELVQGGHVVLGLEGKHAPHPLDGGHKCGSP